ncbi:hypothetical protein V6N13_083506 [Hibiscus sabdariffa]|uniref:Uncharacterized protein n=1 Tax=Hibiscus sabdariffa TaxID=183260 RepID=A0ABR2SY91_9ROSI
MVGLKPICSAQSLRPESEFIRKKKKKKKNGLDMAGSCTSPWHHSWNALRYGQCSVFHPQILSWPDKAHRERYVGFTTGTWPRDRGRRNKSALMIFCPAEED